MQQKIVEKNMIIMILFLFTKNVNNFKESNKMTVYLSDQEAALKLVTAIIILSINLLVINHKIMLFSDWPHYSLSILL